MSRLKTIAALRAIDKEAERKTFAIADEVRERVIVPICRKHKLTFSSGNGNYSFHRADGEPLSNRYGCPRYLLRSFDLLDLDTHDRFNLGHYVADVRASDL